MQKTVVFHVVGLTPKLLSHTPRLARWAAKGKVAPVQSVLPAVTCAAQATYLTGRTPREHGIVANGWYFRDEGEVRLWRQSNHLVQSSKIWDMARSLDPSFTCANLFWWYNMYSSADYEVTPRPMYPADGRKLPDINTKPAHLRHQIQRDLGQFPLFSFWGPKSSIESSQWIADSARWTEQKLSPTLTLIYLPHLDYCLQQRGPFPDKIARELAEIDTLCSDLIEFYEGRGAEVIVLSEYGIMPVSTPVHINRVLRKQGFIEVREELGRELLNPGESKAFAVADHQIAHVYVNDPEILPEVKALLESTAGVAQVLDEAGKERHHLNHPRAGELVAIAESNAWFTYYYWLDDGRAPDFARTVDIHRKPGYDPAELFIDPALQFPLAKVGLTLLKKKLGFRYLMDVIGLDATVVKGSHGSAPTSEADGPLLITQRSDLIEGSAVEPTQVCPLLLAHLQLSQPSLCS
ncbi:MAG: alkaline phosphatase family protein [Elainellaceae cyanobacterium]